uniref:CUE domain-containing protein n=1 Tax=Gossypium raimondii TaxID=29730 RepID=A0A0D2V628_GOSRA|nr:hypothetical protein B456_010G053700 [Gossypium raimondii]KJB64551.1 hypothetical protein B456_010G053700 [Gossypium raimondii]
MKAMKPGVSSLNPYAASYIPLAKREASDNVTAKDIKHGNENAWFKPSSHFAYNPQSSNAFLGSSAYGTEKHQVAEGSAVKSHPAHGSLMQNPGEMTDKQIVDEEFDMDLEYLRMTFPGLSNESLLDVYLANDGDFEATVDMLNQLEVNLTFVYFIITNIIVSVILVDCFPSFLLIVSFSFLKPWEDECLSSPPAVLSCTSPSVPL